jgi:hypothetical protein
MFLISDNHPTLRTPLRSYAILAGVLLIFVIFGKVIAIPAWLVLLLWFGWQLLSAIDHHVSK